MDWVYWNLNSGCSKFGISSNKVFKIFFEGFNIYINFYFQSQGGSNEPLELYVKPPLIMTTSKCFWIGFRSKVSTFMWEWPTHMVLFWKMEGSHFVKHHFPIIFVICLLTFGLLLWLRLKSILGSFCTLFLLCNNIILNYVWVMDSKKKYKPWNWGSSGLKMWQGLSPFEMKWKVPISWFRFYFTNLTVYRLPHQGCWGVAVPSSSINGWMDFRNLHHYPRLYLQNLCKSII